MYRVPTYSWRLPAVSDTVYRVPTIITSSGRRRRQPAGPVGAGGLPMGVGKAWTDGLSVLLGVALLRFSSVARGVLAPLIRHGWPKGNPLKAFFAA